MSRSTSIEPDGFAVEPQIALFTTVEPMLDGLHDDHVFEKHTQNAASVQMAKRALPFARVRAMDDIALGIVGAAETTEFPPLNAAYCIANAAIGPIMANKPPFSRIVRDKDTG